MDSSFFLISNNTSCVSTNTPNFNNDLDQSLSSSSLTFDPFDGFSILDQHHQNSHRLYDYFGNGGGGGGCDTGGGGGDSDRHSPSSFINQCPLDQLDLHHHQHQHHHLHSKNFLYQTDPNQEDDDDLQGTLTSFVDDLGVDSDAGYTSGVDLFANNSFVDCSDSTEAYYLRLALEQNNNIIEYNNNSSSCGSSTGNMAASTTLNNYSDININNYSSITTTNINNINYDCNTFNNCNANGDSNQSQKAKRSVLMNLLIDGSDVGAGYTSHNFRALPQRILQHQRSSAINNNSS